jgi:hypothetical protein
VIVETHERLQSISKIKATRLVVRDDLGRPLLVVMQLSSGHVRYIGADQPDFNEHLASLGLDRTVILTSLDVASLAPPRVTS